MKLHSKKEILLIFSICLALPFWLTGVVFAQTHNTAPAHNPIHECATIKNPPMEQKRQLVLLNGEIQIYVIAEVALHHNERARGPMCRTDLKDNEGMLFFFPVPTVISMWMKNTPLPLDMIFYDTKGNAIKIIENTTPFSEQLLSSDVDAVYALEVKAGFVHRHALKSGHKLLIGEQIQ